MTNVLSSNRGFDQLIHEKAQYLTSTNTAAKVEGFVVADSCVDSVRRDIGITASDKIIQSAICTKAVVTNVVRIRWIVILEAASNLLVGVLNGDTIIGKR